MNSFCLCLIVASKTKNDSVKAKKQKLEMNSDNDDDDEDIIRSTSKRKFSRIIDTDSESDRENESNNKIKADSDDDDEVVVKPARKRSKPDEPSAKKKIKMEDDEAKPSKSSNDSKASKEFQSILQANIEKTEELSDVKEIINMPTVYRHQTLEFLKPGKICDANKRKPSDPNYDPKTLYVPKDYLDSLTPVKWRDIFSATFHSSNLIPHIVIFTP